jgi:hypothetical protein
MMKRILLLAVTFFIGSAYAIPPQAGINKPTPKPDFEQIGRWQLIPMDMNTAILLDTVTGETRESMRCPGEINPIGKDAMLSDEAMKTILKFGFHCWHPMVMVPQEYMMQHPEMFGYVNLKK